MLSALLALVIYFVVAALVIYIVSRLNLGLTVDSFTSAIIAAIVIAVISAIVYWLLGLIGITTGAGLIAAILNLIIAAAIIYFLMVRSFSRQVLKIRQPTGYRSRPGSPIRIGF